MIGYWWIVTFYHVTLSDWFLLKDLVMSNWQIIKKRSLCWFHFVLHLLLERSLVLQQGQLIFSVSKNLAQYEHHFWPVVYLYVPRSDLYCMHMLLHCATDVQKYSFIYWFDSLIILFLEFLVNQNFHCFSLRMRKTWERILNQSR